MWGVTWSLENTQVRLLPVSLHEKGLLEYKYQIPNYFYRLKVLLERIMVEKENKVISAGIVKEMLQMLFHSDPGVL